MPIPFKKGDNVRQVVMPIEGTVATLAIVDDKVQFEVAYTGDDGETHSRFFTEDQIELVSEPEEPSEGS